LPEQDEAETNPQPDEQAQDDLFAEVEGRGLPDAPQEPTTGDEPDGPAEVLPAEPAVQPVRLSRADRDTYDRRQRRFAACGRCGYFVADCRVYLGLPALQAAVLAADDGWVRLEGDATFHRLVKNAYGIDLDMTFEFFDGLCPECRRRFVLDNNEPGSTRLKIHL